MIPEIVEHLIYSFYYTLSEENSYFLKSFADVLNEKNHKLMRNMKKLKL